MIVAAINGHKEVVQTLIDAGASLNEKDKVSINYHDEDEGDDIVCYCLI